MTLHKNRTQNCIVSYGDNGLGHMCPDSRGSGCVRGFFCSGGVQAYRLIATSAMMPPLARRQKE
jgi:hypothetical protein